MSLIFISIVHGLNYPNWQVLSTSLKWTILNMVMFPISSFFSILSNNGNNLYSLFVEFD